jgi:hypothetical protein
MDQARSRLTARYALLCCGLLAMLPGPMRDLRAQEARATVTQLSGIVVDNSGAEIAGATVQVPACLRANIGWWSRVPVLKPKKFASRPERRGKRPRYASLSASPA